MRQHYAPHNRSEDPTEELIGHILFTSVVGYFADAQYDVLFLHVILNEVKDPTEKVRCIYFSLRSWDISLTLNMTCCFSRFLLRGKWIASAATQDDRG